MALGASPSRHRSLRYSARLHSLGIDEDGHEKAELLERAFDLGDLLSRMALGIVRVHKERARCLIHDLQFRDEHRCLHRLGGAKEIKSAQEKLPTRLNYSRLSGCPFAPEKIPLELESFP